MTDQPVLISGAGPTGLVLALYLAKNNIPVRIIDKLPAPLTTSRALAVQARTLEFYDQIGLAKILVQEGHKVPAVNLWVNGRKAVRVPIEHIGQGLTPFPFPLIFPQDQHERLLIDTLNNLAVKVERSTELLTFQQHPTHIQATLKHPDNSTETLNTPYLAGCDGARSITRETLHTNFPGGTYHQIFYVADVEISGPPSDGELHVDLAQSDFIALFPLKGQNRARLVGSLRPAPANPTHEPTFEDASKHALRQLQLTINKVHWFSTYHVHHRVTDHFRQGRVFLLGDAAHIHSPFGGQGMNTGIGDAVNLAWKLAAVLQNRAPDSLLDTYESERIAFARKLVATTDQAFTLATDPSPAIQSARTKLLPALAPPLFQLPPTRRLLFRTVSQIGIHYRHSPLSDGKLGALAAGDRLPWFQFDNATDNFAPLSPLTWQAHIYGSPPSQALTQTCEALHLPLHVFPWHPKMLSIPFRRNALYLIRPDSHLALIDKHANPQTLQHYFTSRGIFPSSPD